MNGDNCGTLSAMNKIRHSRGLVLVVMVLVLGGLLLGMTETEGANHQNEVHHCVACCTNHHMATSTQQETFQHILLQEHALLSELTVFHPQPVVRLPERPPKHLA